MNLKIFLDFYTDLAYIDKMKLSEIYNQIAYHTSEIEKLREKVEIIKQNCEHVWEQEEGYLFSGFYCRKCGSIK